MSDTRSPGEVQAAEEQGEGDPLALANVTTTQANRTAMQGGGVGQREMDAQQDPTRIHSQENTAADE